MTVEDLDTEISAAMSEWAQSFKAPTEAFRARMDAAIAKAKGSGVNELFIATVLIKSVKQLEDELEQVVGNALTPEMMLTVEKASKS